jgi:parallel beta-helix repeat protein
MIHRRELLLGLLAAGCDGRSSLSGPSLKETTNEATFVAPNGNDANSGTQLAPVRTLTRALNRVRPGTTLFLKGGVYQEELGAGIPSGASWSAPVRIGAFQGQPAIVRPLGTSRVLFLAGPSYVVIDGLILDGARVTLDAVKITSGGGGRSHHIRIQNTEVMNAPGQGILITDGADSNEFINVRVHHNGRNDFTHGIYVSTNHNLIENCEIFQNSGWGVHAFEAPNNLTVRGCRIYQNARIGARGPGIGLYGGEGLRAFGNEVSGNAKGIEVDYSARGAEIVGNRIHGNRGEGILIGGGASGTRVDGNAVTGNGGGSLIDRGAGTRVGSNQLG